MTLTAPSSPAVELEFDQQLATSLRTIALGQFDRVETALRRIDTGPDLSVHTARKTMKRLRALIRLVRDEVGYDAYRAENVVLRNAGRTLARARDGFAVIGALDRLCDGYAGLLAPDAFQASRAHLLARHDRVSGEVLGDRQLLTNVVVNVKTARARFASWDGAGVADDFTGISDGLQRVYTRGRRGMQRAYATGTVEAFHEWRKRVKYLRYQTETLLPLWPELLAAQASRLDRLGELLGDDHDLAVLAEIVTHDDAATGDQRERTLLLSLIHRSRLEHQWQARNLGRALYAEEPEAFVARMGGYWRAARGD